MYRRAVAKASLNFSMLMKSGRWHVSAIAGIAASIAAIGSVNLPLLERFTLFLSMWLVTMSGFIWNDLFDAEMDRRAGKIRPITTGTLSRVVATCATAVACLLALLASFLILGGSPTGVLIATVIALLFYSPLARVHPLLKPAWVASLSLVPFALGAFALELRPNLSLLGLGFAFIFARELLIDLQDSHSDKAWGIRTIDELCDQKLIERGCWVTLVVAPFLGATLVDGSISVALFLASALTNVSLIPVYLRDQSKGLVLTRLSMLFAVLGISIGFGVHSAPAELW